MPARVGASPGTSVAAAAHSRRAEAEPDAGDGRAQGVARGAQAAQHGDQQQDGDREADHLPDRKPPIAAPSIGSPDMATSTPERAKPRGGVLEPVASRRVGSVAVWS